MNKFEASLTDAARVIIYDCCMFIVQDTGTSIGLKYVFKLLYTEKSQNLLIS